MSKSSAPPQRKSKWERTQGAIVSAGSRRFREKGYAATSLRDIMGDCGLTMGGFYAHFASKGDLFAACFSQSAAEGAARVFAEKGAVDYGHAVARYLSEEHIGDKAGGCPLAALLSELDQYRRENPTSDLVDLYVRAFADGLQARGAQAGKSLGLLSLMLGALTLARTVRNRALGQSIVSQSLSMARGLRQTPSPSPVEKTVPNPKSVRVKKKIPQSASSERLRAGRKS